MIRLDLRARVAFLTDNGGVAFDERLLLEDNTLLYALQELLAETALPLTFQNHVIVTANGTLERMFDNKRATDHRVALFSAR
jgi:hypothetical protein